MAYLRMSCRSQPMIWNRWFLPSQYSHSITFKCSCKSFVVRFPRCLHTSTLNVCHARSKCWVWDPVFGSTKCLLWHTFMAYCDSQIPYFPVAAGKLAIHQRQSVSLLPHGVLWLAGDLLSNGLSPPLVWVQLQVSLKPTFLCGARQVQSVLCYTAKPNIFRLE